MIKLLGMAVLTAVLSVSAVQGIHAQQSVPGDNKPSAVTDKYQQAMKKMDEKTKAEPKTGNADHDFIVMMIEHHRGAIEMGEILMNEGKNEELRQMVQESMKKQKEEIAKLQKILEKVKENQDTGTTN